MKEDFFSRKKIEDLLLKKSHRKKKCHSFFIKYLNITQFLVSHKNECSNLEGTCSDTILSQ